MKKIVLIIFCSSLFTSCTIQDVINYMNGKANNLSQEEVKQVENKRVGKTEEELINSITEKEKSTLNPPQH